MLDFNIINLSFTIGIYFRLIHTEGIVFSIKGICRAMLYQKRGSYQQSMREEVFH